MADAILESQNRSYRPEVSLSCNYYKLLA